MGAFVEVSREERMERLREAAIRIGMEQAARPRHDWDAPVGYAKCRKCGREWYRAIDKDWCLGRPIGELNVHP